MSHVKKQNTLQRKNTGMKLDAFVRDDSDLVRFRRFLFLEPSKLMRALTMLMALIGVEGQGVVSSDYSLTSDALITERKKREVAWYSCRKWCLHAIETIVLKMTHQTCCKCISC
eukprot:4487908-Amphidinium_carterae.1